ncbi:hypothetical protein COCVIDRAFT_105374, partial [Bipolaris victoriae FI3]
VCLRVEVISFWLRRRGMGMRGWEQECEWVLRWVYMCVCGFFARAMTECRKGFGS